MQSGQGGAKASEWSLRSVTAVFVHSNLSLKLRAHRESYVWRALLL